jgi:gamma-glutamyl-gamma-aminobutyrate hydrolase PuuD
MKTPLILQGGVDISSRYYNEPPNKHNQHPNPHRDAIEFEELGNAIKAGRPSIGICRGAQLQCIINGGSLYQHSESPVQNHEVQALHWKHINGNPTIRIPKVPGAHHQIMKPFGTYHLLGWNPDEVKVWDTNEETHTEAGTAEIVWWPETKCLGIQGHPEWCNKNHPLIHYLNHLLEELDINYAFKEPQYEFYD